MLLELSHIGKSFGAEQILEDINLSVGERDRIGLLGANGAGKSTLLNVITGELESDVGEIALARGAEIGYLRQNGALNPGRTIGEEIASVFDDVRRMGEQLEELRRQLESCSPQDPQHDRLLAEYDALNTAYETHEGYTIDVKINTVLGGMGFASYDREMYVSALSGGEKTRLAIAKLLLGNPQLLILDEPTNHLDFTMLTWLEEYLRGYRGALIVVSHDRYFLDNVATDICELENRHLTRYPGGYTQFVRLKQERREFQQKQYDRQQQKIEKLEDFISRNIVRASTSGMAKSRIHMLEHMERVDKPLGEAKSAYLRFEADVEPYKDVLVAEGISVSVGEGDARKMLCHDIDLHILKGEKVALIGNNGVGKSSLLRALMDLLPHAGRVKWGVNTKLSYFEQENRQLDWNKTVIDEVHSRFPRKYEVELRTLLGSLLLSGDDIYKKVGDLSGGERAKVAFAIIMLERSNVLILDEPTNHLDYKTKEILEEALIDYPGTLIMVSHDRYLLNRVPTRIIEMHPERLTSYYGGYDYYVLRRDMLNASLHAQQEPVKKTRTDEQQNPFYRSKAQRSEQAKKKARIATLEKEIQSLEEKIASLEYDMTTPDISSDYQKLEECCRTLEETRTTLSQCEDEWLRLGEELEGV